MIKETLYNRTVDILVQAYFNDRLAHNNCNACAVGNLVSANLNYPLDDFWWAEWSEVFMTVYGHQEVNPSNYKYGAKKQIDSTGYTWEQLAKIEYAFESVSRGKSDEDWMFNGLMAVIDVLDVIHENTDANLTKQSKQKFIKAY